MIIRTLSVGMLGTQCSLVWQEDREDCLVIDPGAEAERIRAAAGDWMRILASPSSTVTLACSLKGGVSGSESENV